MDYLRRVQRLVGKANLTDNVYNMLLDEVDFYGLQDSHDKLVAQRHGETQKKTEQKFHLVFGDDKYIHKGARKDIDDHEKDGWKVQCMITTTDVV
jgi:hypothetical protein